MQKVTLALLPNEILKMGENYQGSRSIIQKKALDVLGWYIIRRNSVEKGSGWLARARRISRGGKYPPHSKRK